LSQRGELFNRSRVLSGGGFLSFRILGPCEALYGVLRSRCVFILPMPLKAQGGPFLRVVFPRVCVQAADRAIFLRGSALYCICFSAALDKILFGAVFIPEQKRPGRSIGCSFFPAAAVPHIPVKLPAACVGFTGE